MSLQFATIFSGLAAVTVPFTDIEAKYGLMGLLLAVFLTLLCIVVKKALDEKEAMKARLNLVDDRTVEMQKGYLLDNQVIMKKVSDSHERLIESIALCRKHEEAERAARQLRRDSGDLPRVRGE